ncbi:2,3-butanediol dehydrogenase, partial [Bacillus sp. JJ722]|uniref:2,3-butanediol dehydrogenase n=1 Tax=Bacillus sp. JJ722 TaxID=3122973 RepID=UPI0030008ED6
MKAAVIYGKKDVRIEDWKEPTVETGHVKVKVAWAGVCGSDLHAYHHGMGISLNPHPVSNRQVPLVFGHEFAGTVVEVGEEVTNVQVGDRVAVEPLIYSKEDYYVKQGKYNLSNDFGFIGLNGDGGFAQFTVVSASSVHKLPNQVSLEEGALIEPTAVAMQAVKASALQTGDTVAVFGAGPIGLLTVIAAKAAGASKVFVIDLSQERLDKALEVGADVVINSASEDVKERIIKETVHGVAVSYEAAGVQPTFTTAVDVLKKGGQLMVIAAYAKPVELNINSLLVREINIVGSIGYRHVFPEVIQMIASGQMDVKKVITKKIQLDNLVEDGLE